nr:hypothetical protein [Tanacetum cinerariifolium]
MGEDYGIKTLVKSILDGSALGSFGHGGGDFLEKRATKNTNIKSCLHKVIDGHFTTAMKMLSSLGVVLYCDDTNKALEAKHPYNLPPSVPSITFFEPPFAAKIDSVFSCIKLFPKGRYSPILAEFVASAPLTPLLKPDNRIQPIAIDNKIQPIAIGTIWRRLVFKVSMKGVGKEMLKYLSNFQFRVGVSGGAKALLHSVNRVLSKNDGSLTMLTMDLPNAFNLVDRSALLHEQGDPFGPLRFALILHPLLHKIKDTCKLLLHAWYLDDGTVIRHSREVSRVLNIIKRSSSGVKLLGGAISRDAYFISGLSMRRATNVVDLMSLLPQLHDPQSELLLLRSCMGIAKLFFGLRTCQPVHKEEATLFF